ncbi:MAG TPA: SUF system NifU family Fe-S cluster assembly protein [Gemmatimonadaceae bacterium]
MSPPDASPTLAALYQSLILEHYRRPRNQGVLDDADVSVTMKNPLCGDELVLQLAFDDAGGVRAARFRGQGCSISLATASMMTEYITGKSRDEIDSAARRFAQMLAGDAEVAADPALGDLRALSGVAKVPARIRCAQLPWEALERAFAGRG